MFEAEFVPDGSTGVLSGYCSSELGGVISIFCVLLLIYLRSSGESSSDWDLSFSINQLLNYLESSGELSSDWDLSFSINQLQLLFTTCPDAARDLCRPQVPFVR